VEKMHPYAEDTPENFTLVAEVRIEISRRWGKHFRKCSKETLDKDFLGKMV
jgi:hypothetical protein